MMKKDQSLKNKAIDTIMKFLTAERDTSTSHEIFQLIFNDTHYITVKNEAEKFVNDYGIENILTKIKKYEVENCTLLVSNKTDKIELSSALWYLTGDEILQKLSCDIADYDLLDVIEELETLKFK